MTTKTDVSCAGSDGSVLSLEDVSAESSLLRSHDLRSLHTRLEGALRRRGQRQVAAAWIVGAATIAAAALVAHHGEGHRLPPPPSVTRATAAATQVIPIPPAPPAAPCSPGAAAAPALVVEPRPHVPVRRAPAGETATPTVAAREDDGRVLIEGSRLRAQLRLYDEGQRALDGGDPGLALARVAHLRERYPNGPLDVDAAILGVRALRALERFDEARSALADVEQHPFASEKSAVLAELRLLLARLEPPSPPRDVKAVSKLDDNVVISREPDGSVQPVEEGARQEDRQTRVIGVASP